MLCCLVSNSVNTQVLCREITAELSGNAWTLVCLPTGSAAPANADVCIWDIEDSGWSSFPSRQTGDCSRHLFLFDRESADSARHALPMRDACIVLKPVTKAALSAFLLSSAKRTPAHTNAMQAIRADRDELL